MVKIDFEQYGKDIDNLAQKIRKSGKQYAALYPIPRGGYYPAITLGNILGIPITTGLQPDVCTLIVDDIVDSGKTLEEYQDCDKAVVYAKDYS